MEDYRKGEERFYDALGYSDCIWVCIWLQGVLLAINFILSLVHHYVSLSCRSLIVAASASALSVLPNSMSNVISTYATMQSPASKASPAC